ncbi:PEP-CTERM sorting domain-containing protein [Psychromonas antarctica]|uniref:PEP-CTERM sorting domain-containing protein n=1 Tax=Psychromonas antarctica TaxID=67573 RepID=UPI001EE8DC3D|nr:PEP-CTERM sorting domain-containing protein [Psychromonas antarctica]MCG6201987.1 PEP-CTERM sorting domain-containing protein [Psychromonas antarctica]
MKKIIFAALLTTTCAIANAGVIFSDNFDSEAGVSGSSALNYNSFTNWSVSGGTVDVVANTNGWGISCVGNTGKCVDLDGSNGNAGILSSNFFSLAAGDYALSFDVSGNQRSGSDQMNIILGGFIGDLISLGANSPWETKTYDFTVDVDTTDYISFNHAGGDNMGIMLDNVSLATRAVSVDEPVTIALLGFGLLGLAAARRKQKKA